MTAKKDELAGIIHPANLWGKPLPKSLSRPTKDAKEEKMIHDEEADEPVGRNVRAELENMDEPTDDDLIDEENGDDEDFEPETGDNATEEVVAEDDSEQEEDEESESNEIGATVVTEDEEVVVVTTTRTKKGPAMAETKKKSISDHVRDEIARRQESGDSLRGVDIVTALAARKITVSPAQVSQLLKKAGVAAKARGPRKVKAAAASHEAKSRIAEKATPKRTAEKATAAVGKRPAARETAGMKLPMVQLQAAETFVTACGGLKQAERILTLAAQIAE